MVCKRCGYQNSLDAKYCSGCGAPLKVSDAWQNDRVKTKQRKHTVLNIATGISVAVIIICVAMLFMGNVGGKSVKIAQVLPIEDGSVAVLYTDGTVRVSGNAEFSDKVSDWASVTQLYYDRDATWENGGFVYEQYLFGLTEDGTVLTTAGDFPSWSDVKDLYFCYEGIVGVTGDGNVLTYGELEEKSYLTGLTNVENLVYASIQDVWGCLKKDGSVYLLSDYTDPNEVYWTNVKELRDSGHAFYVIEKDGTVDGDMEDTYAGLSGAVKVVHYNDWVFGISADGRLLTHNGGNIYPNTGDMMVDVPGSLCYGGEVEISQFDQVEDIVVCWGLILLNEDGTAEHIGEYPHWDLHNWRDVQKVCACDSGESSTNLYGLSQDGSVIMNQYDWSMDTQTVTEQYRGWKLQDIYAGNEGVVGLTIDGKLVGDGIYEYIDFTVFDR